MRVKLRELGEIVTGNTPSKQVTEFWDSDDICFVKPDTINETGISSIQSSVEHLAEAARSKARVVGNDAVLVTCIGSIGKIGITGQGEFAFNQQINAIIPNRRVNPKYLAYALVFAKPQLIAIANAPVVPIINKSQFGDFEINIAEGIQEQVEVSRTLDIAAGVISKRQQQLSALDDLIKARFVEMFGDLRSNPKGWPVYCFEDITEIITDGEHATPRRVDQGIYLLSARNVLDHGLQLYDVDFIDQEEYDRIAKRIIPQAGDVLISCSGSVGRCCTVPEGLKFQMVRSAALLRFDKRVLPVYAEYMITSDDLQDQINSSKTASSQANLFQGRIAKLKGFVPPIAQQEQFASFVAQIAKSKSVIQKSLDKTQLLFDSLMQKYFG